MMDEQHHLRDLVAAHVLGAVTPLEEKLARGHLAICADCRGLEAELRAVEARLPALADDAEPPPGLKPRLMRIVEAEAAETAESRNAPGVRGETTGSAAIPPAHRAERATSGPAHDLGTGQAALQPIPFTRSTRSPSVGRLAPAALVAALVLVAVGVGLWRLTGGAPAPTPTTRVALAGTPALPALTGALRYYAADSRLELNVRGARALPPGRVYELWLIRGHYNVVAGVGAFRPAPDGTGRLTLRGPNPSNYTLACLTVERAPGAPRPTFPLVAFGAIGA